MRQNYEFKEFTVENFSKLIEEKQITLPRFQRDVVWTKSQVEDLSTSLKEGFPFGTFLIAGDAPFRLLDGLQRANAIMSIYRKPQEYFNSDQIPTEVLLEFRKSLNDNSELHKGIPENELENAIVYWVKNQPNTDPTLEFKAFTLADYLYSRFLVQVSIELLKRGEKILSPLIKQIVDEVDNIGAIKIPCILYKGSDENLPTIFEKLNSTGTKLSRFQIFAANWVDKLIPNAQVEIKKLIFEEYSERQTTGNIMIEHFQESESEFLKQDLNLYEYLLGLGKLLESKYPYLFAGKGDSIGFTLSSACLQGSIRKIINLATIFTDTFDYSGFQAALFDSGKIVFSELNPYITLRINKLDKLSKEKPSLYHSDYQIISFIAKVFRDKYHLDTFKEKPEWKSTKKWALQIPYHYLYDQLENNWRGSGDKRIEDMLEGDRYHTKISQESWATTLDKWFKEKGLTKKQTGRTKIDDVDLLFLNYIYTYTYSHHDVKGTNEFHLEHLIAVKVLSDYISKNKGKVEGLPISAVSNLCYLDGELNKAKKQKTIYQYIKDNPGAVNIGDIESKSTFTSESEMAFVEFLSDVDNDGWEEFYKEFLGNRFEKLKAKFFELNKIC